MEQLKLAFQFKHSMLPTDILNLFELNSVVSSQKGCLSLEFIPLVLV